MWDWLRRILDFLRNLFSKKKIIAIDSNWEPVTEAGYKYRQANVYPVFRNQGYEIVKAQGVNANRDYVKSRLMTIKNLRYITGVGHGNYELYTGQDPHIIFKVGEEGYDKKEVDNRVVHLLSCRTARYLGPDFVKNGCLAFFGYDENFAFSWGYEEIFFRCDSEIDFSFAKGFNAKQVYDKTRIIYTDAIDALNDEGNYYVAAILQDDLDILRCPSIDIKYGKENVTI